MLLDNPYPHSERSGMVKVNVSTMEKYRKWYSHELGEDQFFNGQTAVLYNGKTKKKVFEIDLDNFVCKDEVLFNKIEASLGLTDTTVRENPKSDLKEGKKPRFGLQNTSAQ